MRKTYVLYTGQLSNVDNRFHFYDIEVYSSRSKITQEIDNRIKVNGGFNVCYDEGFSDGTETNDIDKAKTALIKFKIDNEISLF